ncbi:hypothetical protein EMIHUDRAFT_96978 [Emiliania huxleyi CCMP1516]|uniref:Uncharacterized protein n=2 Tax=Emiliania huxleyi TaxID=2903 RepID=A0A0D3I794_EMIH1|nr:hypothetical protein EMIHUDRAFT_96978 [Emiliania huxleyi CCMP1516]EOD07129.1 hypothetical protein EMIHUDRAFT_96978 [Emiliania huxleyi CCMP1516]|eukprot:XP_005759558.1 hypothetical protein EMIHUDRAFT_96978 [Emiliania huxleyi CCMP1516]
MKFGAKIKSRVAALEAFISRDAFIDYDGLKRIIDDGMRASATLGNTRPHSSLLPRRSSSSSSCSARRRPRLAVVNTLPSALTALGGPARIGAPPAASEATRRYQAELRWCALLYVAGCGIRAVWPRIDVERVCFFDSPLSVTLVGRRAHVRCCEATRGLGRACFPLIFVAQCCCWCGITTTRQVWHGLEESIWAALAAGMLPALLFVGSCCGALICVTCGCSTPQCRTFFRATFRPRPCLGTCHVWHTSAFGSLPYACAADGIHRQPACARLAARGSLWSAHALFADALSICTQLVMLVCFAGLLPRRRVPLLTSAGQGPLAAFFLHIYLTPWTDVLGHRVLGGFAKLLAPIPIMGLASCLTIVAALGLCFLLVCAFAAIGRVALTRIRVQGQLIGTSPARWLTQVASDARESCGHACNEARA